jgi:hypothetical protein
MKNTYTKTEIRISCPFPQVNGPEDKKDKIWVKIQMSQKRAAKARRLNA